VAVTAVAQNGCGSKSAVAVAVADPWLPPAKLRKVSTAVAKSL